MQLLRCSVRGLLQHYRALYFLTTAGVALGVAAVVSIQIINQNALATFTASVQAVSLNADLIVSSRRQALDERLLATVLSEPAVSAAQGVHRVEVAHIDAAGKKRFIDVLGVDMAAPERLPIQGAPSSLGTILETPGWTAVTPQLARELGWNVGDAITVLAGTEAVTLHVGATIDFRRFAPLASSRVLVMDIAQSQGLFRERGVIDEINVFLVSGADRSDVAVRLEKTLAGDAQVSTAGERRDQAAGLLGAFRLNLTALSLISFLVGLFLIHASVHAALVRRRREFGVLRSLGATRTQVLLLILTEASIIGVLGTIAGLPLGYLAASLNVQSVSTTLVDIYLLDEIEQLVIPMWVYGLAAVLGVGGAVFGSLLPALEVLRQPPQALLGRVALSDASGRLAPRFALAGLSFAGSVGFWYCLWGIGHPYAGFVLGIAVLVMLPLIAPYALAELARRAPVRRLGLGYAVRSLQHARAQTNALTVATLGIALSMLVAITLMVGSFRATLEVWISRVVQADVYVSTATSEHARRTSGFDSAVVSQVVAYPGVDYIDTIRRRDATVDGREVRMVGIDMSLPDAITRFPAVEGEAPKSLSALTRESTVLVTEPFSRKTGLWRGDSFQVETLNGARRLTIEGVFYDYSTEKGVVYMHQNRYSELFGEGPPVGLALYLEPGVDAEALTSELRAELGIAGLNIRSNRALRGRVFQIFDQTFAVTRLLQGMGLLIAAFGVTLTLLVLAAERVSEVALYRALGATRRQIFGLFVGKGLALSGLGTALGLVGGSCLAAILILVINRTLFGWTIQVHIPWFDLAEQALAVGLVALLAAVYPALRASETPAEELNRDAL